MFSLWWLLSLQFRLRMGRKYFRSFTDTVVQVSPHRIIKGPCYPCELEALLYVRKHTTVPVPKVYRTYPASEGRIYIEMEYVKGLNASDLWVWHPDQLTEQVRKNIFADLQNYVTQLRNLKPPRDGIAASVSTTGKLWDARIGSVMVGPFDTHDEFHDFLRGGITIEDSTKVFTAAVTDVHTKKYQTRFAHGDLMPRNIIVRKGRIAAIVDWGFGGWYPEYWEFTKAHYGLFPRPDWYDGLYEVLPRYDSELAAEQYLWRWLDEPGTPCHY